MKKGIFIGLSIWIFMAVLLSSKALSPETETFQARLLTGGQQYTESVRKIKIEIDSYTTSEEVQKLIEVQSQQGYEPFMDAFRALNKGTFFPIGGRGIKTIIHAAHTVPTEKGRKIWLFAQRGTWDVEMNIRTDSRFPFLAIELDVDSKGKGQGKMYEQAAVRLTAERTLEMEGYNSPPKQLWDVRLAQ